MTYTYYLYPTSDSQAQWSGTQPSSTYHYTLVNDGNINTYVYDNINNRQDRFTFSSFTVPSTGSWNLSVRLVINAKVLYTPVGTQPHVNQILKGIMYNGSAYDYYNLSYSSSGWSVNTAYYPVQPWDDSDWTESAINNLIAGVQNSPYPYKKTMGYSNIVVIVDCEAI